MRSIYSTDAAVKRRCSREHERQRSGLAAHRRGELGGRPILRQHRGPVLGLSHWRDDTGYRRLAAAERD